tara:strand:+ start:682 stop:1347 length:666 start_codon:yes stop_codon:yes gene_type:complete
MITKSTLHEIEKLWKRLDREKTSISKVKLVKEIISLLDTEDYFEETADFLNTTTLKLRHLTVLSLIEDKEFIMLLEIAGGNLDLCYLFNLFPENDLKSFVKTYKNISSVEKLVYFAANKLDSMHLDSKAEKEIPWISNIKELDKDVWWALADDSRKWLGFNAKDSKKIERFATHSKQSTANWQWLYDLCQQKYNQGLINKKNHKGIKVEHQKEIIKALSLS